MLLQLLFISVEKEPKPFSMATSNSASNPSPSLPPLIRAVAAATPNHFLAHYSHTPNFEAVDLRMRKTSSYPTNSLRPENISEPPVSPELHDFRHLHQSAGSPSSHRMSISPEPASTPTGHDLNDLNDLNNNPSPKYGNSLNEVLTGLRDLDLRTLRPPHRTSIGPSRKRLHRRASTPYHDRYETRRYRSPRSSPRHRPYSPRRHHSPRRRHSPQRSPRRSSPSERPSVSFACHVKDPIVDIDFQKPETDKVISQTLQEYIFHFSDSNHSLPPMDAECCKTPARCKTHLLLHYLSLHHDGLTRNITDLLTQHFNSLSSIKLPNLDDLTDNIALLDFLSINSHTLPPEFGASLTIIKENHEKGQLFQPLLPPDVQHLPVFDSWSSPKFVRVPSYQLPDETTAQMPVHFSYVIGDPHALVGALGISAFYLSCRLFSDKFLSAVKTCSLSARASPHRVVLTLDITDVGHPDRCLSGKAIANLKSAVLSALQTPNIGVLLVSSPERLQKLQSSQHKRLLSHIDNSISDLLSDLQNHPDLVRKLAYIDLTDTAIELLKHQVPSHLCFQTICNHIVTRDPDTQILVHNKSFKTKFMTALQQKILQQLATTTQRQEDYLSVCPPHHLELIKISVEGWADLLF